jgi:hypothetical protein
MPDDFEAPDNDNLSIYVKSTVDNQDQGETAEALSYLLSEVTRWHAVAAERGRTIELLKSLISWQAGESKTLAAALEPR